MKKIITLLALACIPATFFGNTLPDSIGVKMEGTKIYILHKVERGETLYGLCKKYNVGINELTEANPQLKDYQINIDQVLKVPSKLEQPPVAEMKQENQVKEERDQKEEKVVELAVVEDAPLYPAREEKKEEPKIETPPVEIVEEFKQNSTDHNPAGEGEKATSEGPAREHHVQKGETLYSISRQYNVGVSELAQWNNLQGYEIGEGQVLKIYASPGETITSSSGTGSETTASLNMVTTDVSSETLNSLRYKEVASSTYYNEVQETGIATWIKDNSGYHKQNGYYALHKSLPVGSVIKVRNSMNNKVIYAKVIGNLPDNIDNERVLIKLPASAAKELRILDQKANVVISYLSYQQ